MAVRTKQDAYQILADVTGDKQFFCYDGCVAKNLIELSDSFSGMTQDVFKHHVTDEKNDFSKWASDVLGDPKLANDLLHVVSPAEAERVTRARIRWLRSKS